MGSWGLPGRRCFFCSSALDSGWRRCLQTRLRRAVKRIKSPHTVELASVCTLARARRILFYFLATIRLVVQFPSGVFVRVGMRIRVSGSAESKMLSERGRPGWPANSGPKGKMPLLHRRPGWPANSGPKGKMPLLHRRPGWPANKGRPRWPANSGPKGKMPLLHRRSGWPANKMRPGWSASSGRIRHSWR